MQNLKSHSQAIRRGSLVLLSCTLSPYSNIEVVNRCVVAEDVPLSAQGVRERVLRIGRLSHFVHDEHHTAAEVVATWLLGET